MKAPLHSYVATERVSSCFESSKELMYNPTYRFVKF